MSLLEHPRETLARTSPTIVATVYTSDGCDCCRKALAVLEAARVQHPDLVIETVDIASDPDLTQAFQDLTPVVFINDKVRFRGLVNPTLLERLLLAEEG